MHGVKSFFNNLYFNLIPPKKVSSKLFIHSCDKPTGIILNQMLIGHPCAAIITISLSGLNHHLSVLDLAPVLTPLVEDFYLSLLTVWKQTS